MSAGIEGVAVAAEGAAVASHHVVLLDQQHLETVTSEQVGANQTADAGADYNGVIGRQGFGSESAESPRHRYLISSVGRRSAGRLRPYDSCAAVISPLATAAPIEISPARTVAAAISASFSALPAPAQPILSR